MKASQLFFALISLTIALGCKKSDPQPQVSVSVEKYIELLQTNQYDALKLPVFTEKDIPALLKYRNDTQTINNFPNSLIASYYLKECTLGMFALWTIEAIRINAAQSKQLIAGFPSQLPMLVLKNSQNFQPVISEPSQEIVARAYLDWWESNQQKNFNAFKNDDPLTATAYRWH